MVYHVGCLLIRKRAIKETFLTARDICRQKDTASTTLTCSKKKACMLMVYNLALILRARKIVFASSCLPQCPHPSHKYMNFRIFLWIFNIIWSQQFKTFYVLSLNLNDMSRFVLNHSFKKIYFCYVLCMHLLCLNS